MLTRLVAVPLWFISMWLAYALVAYFLGLPTDGGAVLGALTAAFVGLDPTGAFWGWQSEDALATNLSERPGATVSIS